MVFNKYVKFIPLLAAVALFTACAKNAVTSESSTAASTSTGAVLNSVSSTTLSDVASTDVSAGNLQIVAANQILQADVGDIVLDISAIDIHTQGGDYVSVSADPLTVSLAELTNSIGSLVQSNVAPGTYDQLRLTFSAIHVTYANGDTMSYDFSSTTSGQLDNQFVSSITPAAVITSTDVTHLLINSGSIAKMHGRGHGAAVRPSQQSKLIPPFQVINLDLSGSVSGLISSSSTDTSGTVTTSPLSDAIITVSAGGKYVASARSDANGNYIIFGLAAGTYDLTVGDRGFDKSTAVSVAVTVGADTVQDATLAASTNGNSDPGQNSQRPPLPPWDGGQGFDRH